MYVQNKSGVENIRNKTGASNVWRGIVVASENLKKGLRVIPRDGKKTFFWKDIWLLEEALQTHAKVPVDCLQLDEKVNDY